MYRYKLNFNIYTTISFERFTSPLNPKWFASLCLKAKTFSQMFIKNANHSVERTVRIHMDAYHGPDFCFQFLVRFFGLSFQN